MDKKPSIEHAEIRDEATGNIIVAESFSLKTNFDPDIDTIEAVVKDRKDEESNILEKFSSSSPLHMDSEMETESSISEEIKTNELDYTTHVIRAFTTIDRGYVAVTKSVPEYHTILNFFIRRIFDPKNTTVEWEQRGMRQPRKALKALGYLLKALKLVEVFDILDGVSNKTVQRMKEEKKNKSEMNSDSILEPDTVLNPKIVIGVVIPNIVEGFGFAQFNDKTTRIFSSFVRNFIVGMTGHMLRPKKSIDGNEDEYGAMDWLNIRLTHDYSGYNLCDIPYGVKSQHQLGSAQSEVITMDKWTAIAFGFLLKLPWLGEKTRFFYRVEADCLTKLMKPEESKENSDKEKEIGEPIHPDVFGPKAGVYCMQRILAFNLLDLPELVRELVKIVLDYVLFRQCLMKVDDIDNTLSDKILALHIAENTKEDENSPEKQTQTAKDREIIPAPCVPHPAWSDNPPSPMSSSEIVSRAVAANEIENSSEKVEEYMMVE